MKLKGLKLHKAVNVFNGLQYIHNCFPSVYIAMPVSGKRWVMVVGGGTMEVSSRGFMQLKII